METSLTQMQLLGIGSDTNVAEGHPRQALTMGQQAVVGRLGEFLASSVAEPFPVLDARAQAVFFGALGQDTAPIGTGRVISTYSSSVAIDIVCRCLADVATTVGVIHPTLDCIPALLESRGLDLVALSENSLRPDRVERLPPVDAVFVANPNNPTGSYLAAGALAALAGVCADRGIPLVIDSCFRAFDNRAQYDGYAVLDASGAEYVVIEDTGKLWPFGGIKLGFVAFSAGGRLPIAPAASDVLLTAPPFAALVVEALAADMRDGGLHDLHELIAGNRQLLAVEVESTGGLRLAMPGSRVSVAMVRMPDGISSTRVWGTLLRYGVHTVPCRPFYWARHAAGERYLRVALARDPEAVGRAGRTIGQVVSEMSGGAA